MKIMNVEKLKVTNEVAAIIHNKIKTIDWHISLPMDFPKDWDDEMI